MRRARLALTLCAAIVVVALAAIALALALPRWNIRRGLERARAARGAERERALLEVLDDHDDAETLAALVELYRADLDVEGLLIDAFDASAGDARSGAALEELANDAAATRHRRLIAAYLLEPSAEPPPADRRSALRRHEEGFEYMGDSTNSVDGGIPVALRAQMKSDVIVVPPADLGPFPAVKWRSLEPERCLHALARLAGCTVQRRADGALEVTKP